MKINRELVISLGFVGLGLGAGFWYMSQQQPTVNSEIKEMISQEFVSDDYQSSYELEPKIEPMRRKREWNYDLNEEYIPREWDTNLPDYTVNEKGKPSGAYGNPWWCPLNSCPTVWKPDSDSVGYVRNPYRNQLRRNNFRRFMRGSQIALNQQFNP